MEVKRFSLPHFKIKTNICPLLTRECLSGEESLVIIISFVYQMLKMYIIAHLTMNEKIQLKSMTEQIQTTKEAPYQKTQYGQAQHVYFYYYLYSIAIFE